MVLTTSASTEQLNVSLEDNAAATVNCYIVTLFYLSEFWCACIESLIGRENLYNQMLRDATITFIRLYSMESRDIRMLDT